MKTKFYALLVVIAALPSVTFAKLTEPTQCPSISAVQTASLDYAYRISRSPDVYLFKSHAQYFDTDYRWQVVIKAEGNNYSSAYKKAKSYLQQIISVQDPNYVDGCKRTYQYNCEYTTASGHYVELYTVK